MEAPLFEYKIKVPSTIAVVGISASGKTSLVKNILRDRQKLFSDEFSRIIWTYGAFSPDLLELQAEIPELELRDTPLFDFQDTKGHSLYVIDDCHLDIGSREFQNLFIRTSSHQNVTVILILHSLFVKARIVSINVKYFVVLKNNRETLQLRTFLSQIFPYKLKWAMKVYNEICRHSYSYMVICCTSDVNPSFKLRSSLWPEQMILYREPSD